MLLALETSVRAPCDKFQWQYCQRWTQSVLRVRHFVISFPGKVPFGVTTFVTGSCVWSSVAAPFCASAPFWGTDFSLTPRVLSSSGTPLHSHSCHFRHFSGFAASSPAIPPAGRHRQQPGKLLTNKVPLLIFISPLISCAGLQGFSGLRLCGMPCCWSGFSREDSQALASHLESLTGYCNHCPFFSRSVGYIKRLKGWFCCKSVLKGEMCGPVLTEEEAFARLLTKKQRHANQYFWKTLKSILKLTHLLC